MAPILNTSPVTTIGEGRSTAAREEHVLRRRSLLKLSAASWLFSVSRPAQAFTADSAISDRWDLRPIFATPAAWEQALEETSRRVETLKAEEAAVRENPETLARALAAISAASQAVDRLRTYADCSADDDIADRKAQDRSRKAAELLDHLQAQTAWVDEVVDTLGRGRLERLIVAEPVLDRFRFDLKDRLRLAPHRLSQETAGVIAAARPSLEAPHAVYNELVQISPAVSLVDPSGHTSLLSADSVRRLPPSKDQAERSRRSEGSWESRKALEGAFAATLDAAVRESVFEARSRKYTSSLEAALSEPNIPKTVYGTMIEEVDRALPVLHRYYDLRRRMLGLTEFRLSDRSLSLTTFDRRYTLATMRENMVAAVQPLGANYAGTLAQASLARWMDAFPRPNKRDAIYTNPGAYKVHPYLLLNLGDGFVDMTLFTHEWGHAMHAVLGDRAQPYELSNAPLLTRETASTCNEQLLVKHLVSTAQSNQERLFYLAQQMEGYSVIFFNNAMIAEFESAIHDTVEKGGSLSGPQLTETYGDLQKKFYGPNVVVDPAHGREWMYIPHFYTPFYNFQYVPCIAAAAHFSEEIRAGQTGALQSYLRMLQAGGSDYGYRLLQNAGVDLARPEPYRALVKQFSDVMDKAEALFASSSRAS